MVTIELRLSSKTDKQTGKSQVLIRVFKGRLNQRAKSGIFIYPKHFRYYVNRAAAKSQGVNIPDKVVSVTMADAVKRGYPIRESGEVVISERIDTPDVMEERAQAKRLDELKKQITEAFPSGKSLSVPADWLVLEIDKYNNPEKYVTRKEKEEKKSIYQHAEDYLNKMRFSYDHTKAFKVLVRDMARYEAFCRKSGRNSKFFCWDIHTISKRDIEDFEDYLRNEKNLADKYPQIFEKLVIEYPIEITMKHKTPKLTNRGDNTIHKLLVKFKAFWTNWLIKRELTENFPFLGYSLGAEHYGDPFYLTKEERNTLADYDLSGNKSLETQRDIFIFQCLVGCRVGDLMRLTSANINNDMLEYVANKTKNAKVENPRVALNERALRLIKKYEGADEKGRLFPFISAQKYNEAIREAMRKAGINRNVSVRNSTTGETEIHPICEVASSHMARRTFIGILYKGVKDPNLIGKMSGHVEGSRAFARYRKIDDDDLRDVISNLD